MGSSWGIRRMQVSIFTPFENQKLLKDRVTPIIPPAAILLAAGLGRRLGGMPKSALLIDGRSLFERLVQALQQAGIDNISAVIGPYAETLLPLARCSGVRVIHQPMSNARLLSSQRLALLDHLEHRAGSDLMLLVADLPLLTCEDVVPLLNAWQKRPSQIQALVPMVNGVRGHPVFLSWLAVQAAARRDQCGVREWLDSADEMTQVLEMAHDAYTTDLDTADDLDALRKRMHPLPLAWPSNLRQTDVPAQPLV